MRHWQPSLPGSTRNPHNLLGLFTLVAVVITVLMWLADYRNRAALRASKESGEAIEQHEEAGIPTDQRFFIRLRPKTCFETFVTHSRVLDFFTIGMITILMIATWLLYSGRWQLA